MDLILFMTNGQTLRFQQVSEFNAVQVREGLPFLVEFSYYGESTQSYRRAKLVGVTGYSHSQD